LHRRILNKKGTVKNEKTKILTTTIILITNFKDLHEDDLALMYNILGFWKKSNLNLPLIANELKPIYMPSTTFK